MQTIATNPTVPDAKRPVYTVPRGVEAHHVMRFMAARGTRAVLVMAGVRPIGIVTSRDLTDRLTGSGLSTSLEMVEAAMSTPLIRIGEWGAVSEAITTMQQRRITHLPIVSANGGLVSMITLEEAQHLDGHGVPTLGEFIRASTIVPMVQRHFWRRWTYVFQQWIRENRTWWLLAVGLAVAATALAIAMARSWIGFQAYQPMYYEPKDIQRQQYEEQKRRSSLQDTAPRRR